MSVLSDTAIREAMERGAIVVRPLREGAVGSNSVDVHLGRTLLAYDARLLDLKVEPPVRRIVIPDEGYVIEPGRLYLGVTEEYTETREHVPWIDGRSSVGRLGLGVHVTAGRGDVGFCGHWTLEISALAHAPAAASAEADHHRGGVRVYAGMRIAQITYFTVEGAVTVPYSDKPGAKYALGGESADPVPQPSRIWMDFARGVGS